MSLIAAPPARALDLYPFQTQAVDALRRGLANGVKRQILSMPTGSGKCLGAGTPVLTHDGNVVAVETVRPGMALMGPDSKPRYVTSTTVGHGPMVEIQPTKGAPWRCNLDHVLTLERTSEVSAKRKGRRDRGGEIVDVSVSEWLSWSRYRQHIYKLFRTPVDFAEPVIDPITVDPYLLGLLLGDGSIVQTVNICTADAEIVEYCEAAAAKWGLKISVDAGGDRTPTYHFAAKRNGAPNPLRRALKDMGIWGHQADVKWIPRAYLTASREHRLQLLAGLIDSDGHLANGYIDYVSASQTLADDVAFLARSLGLAAYVAIKHIEYNGERRQYHRVSISGELSEVPTRLPRKQAAPRKQKKSVLRTGFKVELLPPDAYYGFTLTGDGRFLLGDFTVTHNTETSFHLIEEAVAKGSRVGFIVDRVILVDQTSRRLDGYGIEHGIVQAGETRDLSRPVQVCSAQTLEKRGYLDDFDVLLVDECFEGGTPVRMVDGSDLPIEAVQVGDEVLTALGTGAVTKTSVSWSHTQWHLRFSNGTRLRCTGSHPFFTASGWAEARFLAKGSRVFRPEDVSVLRASVSSGDTDMPGNRRTQDHGSGPVVSPAMLLAILCEEAQESHGQSRDTQANGRDSASDRTWAEEAGGQWSRPTDSSAPATRLAGERVEGGARGSVQARPDQRLADTLQDRYRPSRSDDRDRGGRSESQWETSAVGSEEGSLPDGVRLVSVSVEELARPVRVFNLTVAGHPSYYAGGILVHNCHHVRRMIADFAVKTGIATIGMTATPFPATLAPVYESIVTGCTTQYLLDTVNPVTGQTYLAPLRIFAATEMDMSGAEVQGGEWTAGAVRERGAVIIGNVVSEWVDLVFKLYGGPVKTLVFSADTAHGEEVCEAFQRAGYDFRQTTYRDTDAETRALVEGFRRGEFIGLCSVSKLTKGFDDETVAVGIDLRSNRSSLTEVIQKMGRVMRSSAGKQFAVWMDCSGNMRGWYDDIVDFWEQGATRLPEPKAAKPIRREGKDRPERTCTCGFVLPPGAQDCPSCGRSHRRRSRREVKAGRMQELTAKGSRRWQEDKRWTWNQMCAVALDWCKGERNRARKLALAKYMALYDEWPPYNWAFDAGAAGDDRVRRKMRQLSRNRPKNDAEPKPKAKPEPAVPEPEPTPAPLVEHKPPARQLGMMVG